MWQGKVRVIFPLGSSGPEQFDEREGKKEKKKKERERRKKRKEKKRGVKSFNFSLDFTVIGP